MRGIGPLSNLQDADELDAGSAIRTARAPPRPYPPAGGGGLMVTLNSIG